MAKKNNPRPSGEGRTKRAPSRATSAPKTRREIEAEMRARAEKRGRIIKIVAIVLTVAILLGIVALVIYNTLMGMEIDYDADLSGYVYIADEHYKKIPVSVKLDPVDDLAIDDALIKILYNYRTLDEEYEGKSITKLNDGDVLGVADEVHVYYIGYLKNDDGSVTYFDGGSNLHQYTGSVHDKGASCIIGYTSTGSEEGEMIPGFALGLIGKNPADYSKLTCIKDRAVKEGDIISFTYLAINPNENNADTTAITTSVRLNKEECDAAFGEGFTDFIVGREIGEVDDYFTAMNVGGTEGRTAYTQMKINAIYELGDNPLTVTARFPVSYMAEELAGKVAYFDLYVADMKLYDVPEIDEKFITERMKMTLTELDEYASEGSTTIYDKFRDYVRSEVIAAQKITINEAAEEATWEAYLKHVNVKWIPEREIQSYYNDYVDEVESAFESASSSGNTSDIDGYAQTYLNLEAGADWRKHLRETAIRAITEKLTFYYVLQREGFIPDEEKYDELYEEIVEEVLLDYLARINCKRENYDSDDAYNAAVAKHRETVIVGYGESYFRENVIYVYAIEKICELAEVTEIRIEPISPDVYTPLVL